MTGNFKEEFEAWCAGDQSEPFEWHSTVSSDTVKAWREKRVPTVSQWQRFWRSPWTWLVLCLWQVLNIATNNTAGASGWLTWTAFITALVVFLITGDERWGKP